MTINVPGRQLQQAHFVSSIQAVLGETGLHARRFGIELTEMSLMEHVSDAAAKLRTLVSLGVEVALDDFGTGYSSLGYLRKLPISLVKIDRSLVPDPVAPHEATCIVRAIIAMVHSLTMRVAAEGVETDWQRELLAANLCDRIQGWYFSPPVPVQEMEAMLRQGRQLPMSLQQRGAASLSLLLVDDDATMLERLRRTLAWRFGQVLKIEAIGSPLRAVERLRAEPMDIVLSDFRMPQLDGIDLLNHARGIQPDAIRMLLVAPGDLGAIIDDPRQVDIFRYLAKPWSSDQLLQHVHAAVTLAVQQRGSRTLVEVLRGRRYRPSAVEKELRSLERQEPGITNVARGPSGEVLLPQQLLTQPGDLWALSRGRGAIKHG